MKKYKDFLIWITITMGSQALIYFLIKLFISDYNIMHSFVSVPLFKYSIYIYDLWYPFVLIVSLLIYRQNKDIFKRMILVMLFSALLAQITFIAYPSMIERPNIEVNDFTDWLLNTTYFYDTPAVNCLPSMHCTYCFIIIYYIIRCHNLNKRYSIGIIVFSFLIILSTLFTKQHILEDVILAFCYTLLTINILNRIIYIKESSKKVS